MEENRLKIISLKFKRLGVSHEIKPNESLILNGTQLSTGKLFLTIVIPILIFVVGVVALGVILSIPEVDRVVFPKIILVLPIVLLIYGIRNLLRLGRSNKHSICIKEGSIQLTDKKGNLITIHDTNLKSIESNIIDMETSYIGEIYAIDNDGNSYLIFSAMDNNRKYLKDDLIYVEDTIKMLTKPKLH